MNNRHCKHIARQYLTTLRKFLANGQESALEEAYELGRLAIAQGLGVLDMARVHEQALEHLLHSLQTKDGRERILKAKETFLLETLSPFEAAHRGFRETNFKLHQVVATLEKRNAQLAEGNRKLELEIRERKRAEKALSESELHYRDLFNEARTMQENLRDLSNKMVSAQEEERKRISRELHDEVGQALTAISVLLATLEKGEVGNHASAAPKIADARRLLRETMETVHRFARELRPAMLDELGLLPAIRSYLIGFSKRTGLRIRFRSDHLAEKLGNDPKTVLFRVVQESLTNVSKHAQASRVEVTLRDAGKAVCLEVADNGKSFKEDAVNSAKSKKRLGLLGMEERVRLVNGQFAVEPRWGKGTTVRVMIPLSPNGHSPEFKKHFAPKS